MKQSSRKWNNNNRPDCRFSWSYSATMIFTSTEKNMKTIEEYAHAHS